MLLPLKKILAAADRGKYAIGAFNVNNMEFLQAVVEAAAEERAPVVVQTSEGAVKYAGMDYLVAMARVAAETDVPVALHLDHGQDLDVVKEAVDAGYTSVMYDGSTLPYGENVANTKKVVGWAKKKGVSVEAELGAIKGIEDLLRVEEREAHFTDPAQAGKFVKATGCDALAVSIGTAHGAYKFKAEPMLDFDRLKRIRAAAKIPLVLHGASGISIDLVAKTRKMCSTLHDCSRLEGSKGVPDEAVKEAVRLGVRKVNIDSDLRIAFVAGLREALITQLREIDPRKLLSPAKAMVKETVRHKIRLLGSAKKA